MAKLVLPKVWHQYDYWNCPTDILTNHGSGERRKVWNGRVNQKGLKNHTAAERTAIVEEWKQWRIDNGSVDFMHGGDACGPTAMGMLLTCLGESITQKEIVHAKHVLAYWSEGDPDEGKAWTKMQHAWDAGGRPDGSKDGKSYSRMDSANPGKLMRMCKYLLGDEVANKYEWINKNSGGFTSQSLAFDFIKECIDGGYPLIVSYKKGPCKSIESSNVNNNIKLQGSGGHYIVVIGYDDDHVIIADPACGKEEKLEKNRVLAAPRRFSVYGSGGYQAQSQDFDGGFMAAWERRGYAYVLVKPKDGEAGAETAAEPVVTTFPIAPGAAPPPAGEEGGPVALEEPTGGLKQLQFRLAKLSRKDGSGVYFTDDVDGDLDDNTKSAVEAFQKDQGLKVDGIPGKNTKAKLAEVWADYLTAAAVGAGEDARDEDFVGPPPPPSFAHGRWSTGLSAVGASVTILLETLGMDDGTTVSVEIWDRDRVGSDDLVKTVEGTVKGGVCEIDVKLDKFDDEWGEFGKNEFYFKASAAGTLRSFGSILHVVVPS